MICNTYYFTISETVIAKVVDSYLNIFISARNGVFVGFIFILLGTLLADNKKMGQMCKKYNNVILTGVLFAFYIVEIIIVKGRTSADDNALYVTQLFFAPALFLLLSSIPCRISHRVSRYLRHLSAGIYFLHRAVLQVVQAVLIRIHFPTEGFSVFMITFLISGFICIVSYKSKNEKISSLLR